MYKYRVAHKSETPHRKIFCDQVLLSYTFSRECLRNIFNENIDVDANNRFKLIFTCKL